jgi:predicted transcriptional regulator of viral defense system
MLILTKIRNMNYLFFRNQFINQEIISTQQIVRTFPNFDSRRLVEWQKKGYIEKVVNRWYRFLEIPQDEYSLFWTSNRIYQPSYISLETALSFHGLIPEGVYVITAISTLKTQTYQNNTTHYIYRNVKPSLYFGYQILRWKEKPILIASPEKAILDFCYLNPHLKIKEDFESLRINPSIFISKVDLKVLEHYLQMFDNQSLRKRIKILREIYA